MSIKLIITLCLMIFFSLFTGAYVKGWIFLYQFELGLFQPFLTGRRIGYGMLSIFILLSHILIVLLPFYIKKKNFKILLYIAPFIFILSFSIISGIIFLLLIPFIICWIISLYLSNKLRNLN